MVDVHRTRDELPLRGAQIPFTVAPTPWRSDDCSWKPLRDKLLERLGRGEDAEDLKLFMLMPPEDVDAHGLGGFVSAKSLPGRRLQPADKVSVVWFSEPLTLSNGLRIRGGLVFAILLPRLQIRAGSERLLGVWTDTLSSGQPTEARGVTFAPNL